MARFRSRNREETRAPWRPPDWDMKSVSKLYGQRVLQCSLVLWTIGKQSLDLYVGKLLPGAPSSPPPLAPGKACPTARSSRRRNPGATPPRISRLMRRRKVVPLARWAWAAGEKKTAPRFGKSFGPTATPRSRRPTRRPRTARHWGPKPRPRRMERQLITRWLPSFRFSSCSISKPVKAFVHFSFANRLTPPRASALASSASARYRAPRTFAQAGRTATPKSNRTRRRLEARAPVGEIPRTAPRRHRGRDGNHRRVVTRKRVLHFGVNFGGSHPRRRPRAPPRSPPP